MIESPLVKLLSSAGYAHPVIFPTDVIEAIVANPEQAFIHADRWVLLGLLPGEYRVDDTCTLRMVPR